MSEKHDLLLGKITSVFGIKGWVKVFSYTEPMENLLQYSHWVLTQQGEERTYKKLDGRRQGKGLVAKLQGIDTPEAAQLLAGAEIRISSETLPALPEGEFYWFQLQGLEVFNQEQKKLGKIDHLMETGANDVLVLKPCEGSIDQQERLVPYLVPSVVLDIDLEAGTMQVDWDADF
ncbi:ribosome maturation factor RimM [Marinospirillum sp.]|uniref:ribosome maturation factor RimM n=1 Tax=Marinospirillum sp. TaxID=2183934 RepID=UPI003A89C218